MNQEEESGKSCTRLGSNLLTLASRRCLLAG